MNVITLFDLASAIFKNSQEVLSDGHLTVQDLLELVETVLKELNVDKVKIF